MEIPRPTDILQAAKVGDERSLELFLLRDNPNIQDTNGNTALILASWGGHVDSVEMILNADADPNIQNDDGNTALIYASYGKRVDILAMLLNAGADPTIRNDEGETALSVSEDEEINNILIDMLFRLGVSPEYIAREGILSLLTSLISGNLDSDFIMRLGNWRNLPPLYLDYL